MCGYFVSNFRFGCFELAKVSNRLKRRGPDDIIVRQLNNGCFVFARLSILDPTSSSMQPLNFHNIDEKPLVLFNGEIYNFQYLAELHLKERTI